MDQPSCPQCGKPLPPQAPQGLCPSCLLQQGMATHTAGYTPGRIEPSESQRWTVPTVAELIPRFPELEILELIGRGGMGAVYKARQKNLDRIVALKILPPEIGRGTSGGGFAQRFAREAQAMAKLSHPHIVTVHDFGQREELYFFVMEYVDGLNLGQVLQAGQVAPKEALAIVPQICDALQYAHDRGIVHRDIKPENILLNRAGQVKIADFGLAKLIAPGSNPPLPSPGVGESRGAGTWDNPAVTDRVLGTPHYMAPEQAEHPQAVDHRADIYALGVVFYQMLTGELPVGRFEAPSKRVQIDVRLDEVVLRALEHEPSRRYQQAGQIKTEVETIVSTPSDRTAPGKDGAAEKEHASAAHSFPAAASSPRERKRGLTPFSSPVFSSLASRSSLATTLLGALIALGAVANFNFMFGVNKTAMLIVGAIVFAAGCIGLAITTGGRPSRETMPPRARGPATSEPPRLSRLAVIGAAWALISLIGIALAVIS